MLDMVDAGWCIKGCFGTSPSTSVPIAVPLTRFGTSETPCLGEVPSEKRVF